MYNKYSVPASQFIPFFFKEYIFHPLSVLCKIFLVHHDSSEGIANDKRKSQTISPVHSCCVSGKRLEVKNFPW